MRTPLVLALALTCVVMPTGVYSAEQPGGTSTATGQPPAASTKPTSVTVRVESGAIAGVASTESGSQATTSSTGEAAVVKFNTKKAQ